MAKYKFNDIVKYWIPSETVLIKVKGEYIVDLIDTVNPIFGKLLYPKTYFDISEYCARKLIKELNLIKVKGFDIKYGKSEYLKEKLKYLSNDLHGTNNRINSELENIRILRAEKAKLKRDYLAIKKTLSCINE